MKTLKLVDGSSFDVAVTSSGASLVFVLTSFADCDPLVQQIKASALASLDDAPLNGKAITAITAAKADGGVQLTFTLSDTTKQQTLDDIAGGIAGGSVSSDIQQIVDLAKKGRDSLSDTDAAGYAEYFPEWSPDSVAYKAGDRVQYGGKLWKVSSDHTSQANWDPADAHSLFAEILPGQAGTPIGEWKQPDASNTYSKGDKVTYNGKTYESTIDNNAWSPEAYPQGWKGITE
ncbi:carbohydrate-binding protein [Porcincola intestinalis]|nr:carbohydrate-binding protein [Porcincola intestinalis]